MDSDNSLWSINSTLLHHFCTLYLHSYSNLRRKFLLETPRDAYASYTCEEYDNGFSNDSTFEFPVVSLSQLDALRYVYSNGISISVSDGVEIVQQLKVT